MPLQATQAVRISFLVCPPAIFFFKLYKVYSILKDLFFIVIGCFLAAVGTGSFLLPNQLSSGGFAGIATIFYYFFKIPMGTTILAFNIPLFIFSAYKLGKFFFIKSIIKSEFFNGSPPPNVIPPFVA